MQTFKWGRGVSKDEGPIWGGVNESSVILKPYQVMITMNDPQCNPQQGLKWCNLAQNSQTFPTWPFIFQNIAFALCSLFLTTNAKPFVKTDFTFEQVQWNQLLFLNQALVKTGFKIEEQSRANCLPNPFIQYEGTKTKKTFPFFFLAAVISCVNIFLPFPSSFHPWYNVSKNDI